MEDMQLTISELQQGCSLSRNADVIEALHDDGHGAQASVQVTERRPGEHADAVDSASELHCRGD